VVGFGSWKEVEKKIFARKPPQPGAAQGVATSETPRFRAVSAGFPRVFRAVSIPFPRDTTAPTRDNTRHLSVLILRVNQLFDNLLFALALGHKSPARGPSTAKAKRWAAQRTAIPLRTRAGADLECGAGTERSLVVAALPRSGSFFGKAALPTMSTWCPKKSGDKSPHSKGTFLGSFREIC